MTLKEIIANQKRLKTLGATHKRGKLWQAMRILRTFTCLELAAVCEMPDAIDSIRTYVAQLHKVGFMSMQRKGSTRYYRLIRNTGPLAPYFMRNRTIYYDPNTQEEFIYACSKH